MLFFVLWGSLPGGRIKTERFSAMAQTKKQERMGSKGQ
jgi:hypothetical protein